MLPGFSKLCRWTGCAPPHEWRGGSGIYRKRAYKNIPAGVRRRGEIESIDGWCGWRRQGCGFRFAREAYQGHMSAETAIRGRCEAVRPGPDKGERRLLAAEETRTARYGGVRAVVRATGIARVTIDRGVETMTFIGNGMTSSRRAHPRPSHEPRVSTLRLRARFPIMPN